MHIDNLLNLSWISGSKCFGVQKLLPRRLDSLYLRFVNIKWFEPTRLVGFCRDEHALYKLIKAYVFFSFLFLTDCLQYRIWRHADKGERRWPELFRTGLINTLKTHSSLKARLTFLNLIDCVLAKIMRARVNEQPAKIWAQFAQKPKFVLKLLRHEAPAKIYLG